MKLNEKKSRIKKVEGMELLKKYSTIIAYTDFNEIKFAVFELKESLYRLEEYLYYSDTNPFSDNISYIKYSRFVYESYLNDTYIIQTRFRKLIDSIKKEARFNLTANETRIIEENFSVVVKKMRKITKDLRGGHVHDRRYNDKDFMICDLMERENRIHKMLTGKPKQEYDGKDLYYYVTVGHLNDVQDMIIENNNYIYGCLDDFLKKILEIIIDKICVYIDSLKK